MSESKNRRLVPVTGCWVIDRRYDAERRGKVMASISRDDGTHLRVKWHGSGNDSLIPLSAAGCGFKLGMDVEDLPLSRVRGSLGEGTIIALRSLGGREFALVEFPVSGSVVWTPYENLRQIKGVLHHFLTGKVGGKDRAEHFRLRSLAYALESWNENTGSLSRFDIDPLPHQIHLVHHILASGNLNWLIADDVGLGKTIEVGLLLSALRQRKKLGRVLLVTPAGLTKQWQDELHYKFGMDDFMIYGENFRVDEPHHWKMYDRVIGSMDRLKDEAHLGRLLSAPPWDMVVFDEAHRLSRRQYGMKLESSERFRLAAALRSRSENIVLLSATPHQGKQDKFQALLEILRPEWKREIRQLDLNPEILQHMVIRNHKADVTDSDGNFIFKSKITKAIKVDVGQEAREFDRSLQEYLRRGYSAGSALGRAGIAIGFVMTIYRKLAASSAAAIHTALSKRLARLREETRIASEEARGVLPESIDERFVGETEELVESSAKEFFDGEEALLAELVDRAASLKARDEKLQAFLEKLIPIVIGSGLGEKLLVFTEYRTTQDHLAAALRRAFGEDSVALIHGSMGHAERRAAIERFEDTGLFLISTEAGGEGINLQRRCHIMVNYDLPWNPMRLVQRIGRLYRYGQERNVVVFNINAPQTVDEQIIELMYERIGQVVHDMAQVGEEFRAGLEDDILGQFAELMDVAEILEDSTVSGIARTEERIEDALRKAREAAEKQRELFEYATSFKSSETKDALRLGPAHLRVFVEGMCALLGFELSTTQSDGRVLTVRLSETVAEKLPQMRKVFQATFDRELASRRPKLHILDLDSPVVAFLLKEAKSYEFGGQTAVIRGIEGRTLCTCMLRWQNDQGTRQRQEFTAFQITERGEVEANPPSFAEWLTQRQDGSDCQPDRELARVHRVEYERAIGDRLAAVANENLHPENRQWVGAAWRSEPSGTEGNTPPCIDTL